MLMKNSNDTIGNRTRNLPVNLNQLRHRVPRVGVEWLIQLIRNAKRTVLLELT
jgi:hypothetical protein